MNADKTAADEFVTLTLLCTLRSGRKAPKTRTYPLGAKTREQVIATIRSNYSADMILALF